MAESPDIFNSNQWYRLYTGSGKNSFWGDIDNSVLETTGSTSIEVAKLGDERQRWQISKFNSTVWKIRFQHGGPNVYLGTKPNDTTSVPQPVRDHVSDASVYWTIHPWEDEDDRWYLKNLKDGPDYLLTERRQQRVGMDLEITAGDKKDQKWKFEPVAGINDNKFLSESVSLLFLCVKGSSNRTHTDIESVRTYRAFSHLYLHVDHGRYSDIDRGPKRERHTSIGVFHWSKGRNRCWRWRRRAHRPYRAWPFPLAQAKATAHSTSEFNSESPARGTLLYKPLSD
jgi:hypothetical protein